MSPRRRIRSPNPDLTSLIRLLRKKSRENEAALWRDVAERISKPKRMRIAVNISRINRHSQENDDVLVPGKVLGAGILGHPVKVAAVDFSDQARAKILEANGKCLSIPDLVEMNPKGTKVKLIG